MAQITDEYMQQMLATIKSYCIALLKPTGTVPGNLREILWEHARKNFALREDGLISIVAPVSMEAAVSGLYIFNTSEEEAAQLLNEDPAVQAGIFSFETYPCKSFPGDYLK